MKLSVRLEGSLARRGEGLARRLRSESVRIANHLNAEMDRELQSVRASNLTDPDSRRDALERAVRRVWGAPL